MILLSIFQSLQPTYLEKIVIMVEKYIFFKIGSPLFKKTLTSPFGSPKKNVPRWIRVVRYLNYHNPNQE